MGVGGKKRASTLGAVLALVAGVGAIADGGAAAAALPLTATLPGGTGGAGRPGPTVASPAPSPRTAIAGSAAVSLPGLDGVSALAPDGAGILDVPAAGSTSDAASSSSAAPVAAAGPPAIASVVPASGLPGYHVHIQGTNLAGATGVVFGGAAAVFVATSDHDIWAAVPAGAGGGQVKVVTAAGSAWSPQSFWVDRPAAIRGLASTSAGIAYGQVFNYGISQLSSEVGKVGNFVWGSSSATAPGGIFNTYYFPFDRDGNGNRSLSWYQNNHPSWVEFNCSGQVAYEFGQSFVPIDISNPDARATIFNSSLAVELSAGYSGIAFDNVNFNNPGHRCGHYTYYANGVWSGWVSQYSGRAWDPAYEASVVGWAKGMGSRIHYSGGALAVNLSPVNWSDRSTVSNTYQLYQAVDYVADESGFVSASGSGWTAAMAGYNQLLNRDGRGLLMIDQEPTTTPTAAQKEWAIGNYLLIKNNATSLYIAGPQQYGSLLYLSEYAATVGSPIDDYYPDQHVYRRDLTSSVVFVNPSAGSGYSIQVPPGHWQDLESLQRVSGGASWWLPAHSALVLLAR